MHIINLFKYFTPVLLAVYYYYTKINICSVYSNSLLFIFLWLDFHIWKEQLEKKTNSSFVMSTGEKKSVDTSTMYTNVKEVGILHHVVHKNDI